MNIPSCFDASKQSGYNLRIMKRKSNYSDFQKWHRTEWKDFLWNQFLETIAGAKNKKAISETLDVLFSEYEKSIITKRLAALALIRTGVGSREIGRILWMSHPTISALRKTFFGNSRVYKSQRSFKTPKDIKPAKPMIKKPWLSELFTDIDIMELLKNPPRPTGTGLKR